MRFPRFCRPSQAFLERRNSHLAGQFCIGEALPCHLRYCQRESIRIGQRVVLCGAVIEAEYLLTQVLVKMERLYSNVCAAQSPLSRAE